MDWIKRGKQTKTIRLSKAHTTHYTLTINSSPPIIPSRNDAVNLTRPKICAIDLQITWNRGERRLEELDHGDRGEGTENEKKEIWVRWEKAGSGTRWLAMSGLAMASLESNSGVENRARYRVQITQKTSMVSNLRRRPLWVSSPPSWVSALFLVVFAVIISTEMREKTKMRSQRLNGSRKKQLHRLWNKLIIHVSYF